MAPTSPSGCDSCSRFAVKIAELEERISTLHQIREAELLMDTITFALPQTISNCAPARDAPASGPDAAPVAAEDPPPPEPVTAAHAPLLDAGSDASWIYQGAKPKVPISSTPAVPQPWSLVTGRGRGRKRSPDAPRHNIPLENRFAPLNFPSVNEEPQKHTPPSSVLFKTRRSIPQLTLAPRRGPVPLSVHQSPASSSPLAKSSPTSTPSPNQESPYSNSTSPHPLFPPTTLIIGDSITRNIRFFNAITHCFPGATVPAILAKLPNLLNTLPSSVHRIILHVGTNDCSHRHSEVTKIEFRKLLQFLNSCGKSVLISGPLSPHGCGSEKFSRVLQLHTWLQSLCKAHNVGFIDNFNLFWNRQSFFKSDGIHPNKLGTHILKTNLQYAVQHARD